MSIIIALNGKNLHEVEQARQKFSVDWKDLIPDLAQKIKLRDDEEIIGVEASEGFLDVKVMRKRAARKDKGEKRVSKV